MMVTIKRLKLLFAVLVLTALYACAPPVSRCAKALNPVECAQVARAGGDVDDYLRYGLVGYMLVPSAHGPPVIAPDPHYRGWRRAVPRYAAEPQRRSMAAMPRPRPTVRYGFRSSGFRSGRR